MEAKIVNCDDFKYKENYIALLVSIISDLTPSEALESILLFRNSDEDIKNYKPILTDEDRFRMNGVKTKQKSKNDVKIKEVCPVNEEGETIGLYPSISSASRVFECDRTHISRACKNVNRTAGGYKWLFKNDVDLNIKYNHIEHKLHNIKNSYILNNKDTWDIYYNNNCYMTIPKDNQFKLSSDEIIQDFISCLEYKNIKGVYN